MSEKDHQKKVLIMKIGVALFTLFIGALWVLNLKNVWHQNQGVSTVKNQESLANLKNDFGQTLSNIQNKFEQNKENSNLNNKTDNDNLHFLHNLAKNIEYNSLQKTLSSSSNQTASSSASQLSSPSLSVSSSSKNIINKLFTNKKGTCPEYINCMPTIDGPARSCQIPKGCEDITILAY